MDTTNGNFPWPDRAQLQREADAECRAAEAKARADQIKKTTDAWAALKNDLAALVNQAHAVGTWGRGYHLAHIEDADHHVLSILEDV